MPKSSHDGHIGDWCESNSGTSRGQGGGGGGEGVLISVLERICFGLLKDWLINRALMKKKGGI